MRARKIAKVKRRESRDRVPTRLRAVMGQHFVRAPRALPPQSKHRAVHSEQAAHTLSSLRHAGFGHIPHIPRLCKACATRRHNPLLTADPMHVPPQGESGQRRSATRTEQSIPTCRGRQHRRTRAWAHAHAWTSSWQKPVLRLEAASPHHNEEGQAEDLSAICLRARAGR